MTGVVALGVALLFAVYGAVIVVSNRRVRPINGPVLPGSRVEGLPKASHEISIMSWNIGYAGLGKNADLVVDHGKSLRALSHQEIATSAKAIAQTLDASSCDVICLQENARAGFLTRRVPVSDVISNALCDRLNYFWTDMKSVCVPRVLHVDNGMSLHSRLAAPNCQALAFKPDDIYLSGILKKHYGTLYGRFPISDSPRDWVVFNIHLSAFDTAGHARQVQLDELLQLAKHEYALGNYVLIAGDWNMRLTPTDFPHKADPEKLLWVSDFPNDTLPPEWRVACASGTPTVRSLNAAYVNGQTYTTIVDGFVYSPNVRLKKVETRDMQFEYSDHHPVEAQFIVR